MGNHLRSSLIAIITVALMPLTAFTPLLESSAATASVETTTASAVVTSANGPASNSSSAAAIVAAAAVKSNFDPGNIISDAIFYDPSTMSATDIQSFLNGRVPNCVAGYTCLKDYRESYDTRAARVEGCTSIPAGNSVSAAQIIRTVSQACGINPRVILTLLEKEQSLVSSRAPSERQYRSATGYGCPDTAACDTAYYGFFNQVYNASRQFKYYQYNPSYWNYKAGRVNTILWHPNSSCGTSQVYIANQATAGLYIYTPYRPNDAALNNLYGTGDACSSYGNRNFWRIFTDWFGSTTISDVMVRASNSLQIWLLSNGQKFPINNPDIYASLSPLGGVSVVSPEYLANLPTQPEVSRFIGDASGNLYFVDSGKRYHIDSCSRAVDWGFSCPNWTSLEDRIVALLPSGGQLTNVARDASNQYWQIIGQSKRQAVDSTALAAVDGNSLTVVSNAALASLAFAQPILRNDIVVREGNTSNYWINSDGLRTLSSSLYSESSLDTNLPVRTLLTQSTALLSAPTSATGMFANGSAKYLLTETGKSLIPSGIDVGIVPTEVSAATLSNIPTVNKAVGDPIFMRAVGTAAVFLVQGGTRHVIASWDDYSWLAASVPNSTIYVVPTATVNSISDAGPFLRPGTIVRATGTPAAYLVDGAQNLHLIQSYNTTAQLGFGSISREVPQTSMDAFTKQARPLSRVVSCNGQTFLGVDGTLRAVDPAVAEQYALSTPTVLDLATCNSLRMGTPLTPFIQKSSGAVYYVVAGQRRHIPNADVFRALGGTAGNLTPMSDASARDFPADVPLFNENISERPSFMRAEGTPGVYIVRDGIRSVIQSWDDYLYAARGIANPSINVSPQAVVDELPLGSVYLRPGMFIRPSDSLGVFLLDGSTNRIVLGSIDPYTALGGSSISVIPPAALATYTIGNPNHLKSTLTCGAETYIGLGGLLYLLTDEVRAQYGTPSATTVQPETCSALPRASAAPGKFLLAQSGSVYMMDAGAKHPVRSPAGFEALGGNWSTLIKVSDYTLSQFATGSAVG